MLAITILLIIVIFLLGLNFWATMEVNDTLTSFEHNVLILLQTIEKEKEK